MLYVIHKYCLEKNTSDLSTVSISVIFVHILHLCSSSSSLFVSIASLAILASLPVSVLCPSLSSVHLRPFLSIYVSSVHLRPHLSSLSISAHLRSFCPSLSSVHLCLIFPSLYSLCISLLCPSLCIASLLISVHLCMSISVHLRPHMSTSILSVHLCPICTSTSSLSISIFVSIFIYVDSWGKFGELHSDCIQTVTSIQYNYFLHHAHYIT